MRKREQKEILNERIVVGLEWELEMNLHREYGAAAGYKRSPRHTARRSGTKQKDKGPPILNMNLASPNKPRTFIRQTSKLHWLQGRHLRSQDG